eukprot:2019241-Pleurochrysis_carterae.AAC.2
MGSLPGPPQRARSARSRRLSIGRTTPEAERLHAAISKYKEGGPPSCIGSSLTWMSSEGEAYDST